jgi:hypothetical protein
MIKRTLFLTLSLLLVFSVCAFAGEGSDTVGGGKLLPQLRYGYSVSDWDRFDSPTTWWVNDWDYNAHDYYLQVNWGAFDNLDIIALVGGETFCTESEFDTGADVLALKSGPVSMFKWGVGFKATFFRADNGFYAGGGALFTHAFSGNYRFERFVNGASIGDTAYSFTRSVYKIVPELHVGYHFKNIGLTPYAGVDYVWSRANNENSDAESIYQRIENPFNMFVGVDYFLNDRLYINVEGRGNFVDGWGVESGIGYLFDICGKPAPAPEPAPVPVIEPKLEPMSKN